MVAVYGQEPTIGFKGKRKGVKPLGGLGKGLSSYQLFRATLLFLAEHPWGHQPVFVKVSGGHRYPPSSYETHTLVFVDSSSTTNLLAGVPLGSMKLLSADARRTLDTLGSLNNLSAAGEAGKLNFDPFPEIFLKDHRDLQTRFDCVIR